MTSYSKAVLKMAIFWDALILGNRYIIVGFHASFLSSTLPQPSTVDCDKIIQIASDIIDWYNEAELNKYIEIFLAKRNNQSHTAVY